MGFFLLQNNTKDYIPERTGKMINEEKKYKIMHLVLRNVRAGLNEIGVSLTTYPNNIHHQDVKN